MTEITIFTRPEFGKLRTLEIDGEPWFVGKDVAEALGYGEGKSPINAVANHVDEEDKGVTELMTPGGMQKVTIINESGLYSLVLSSKLPSAYNMPTQRAMEAGLFEIKETAVNHSDGHITVSKTPKVTGKGQQYFVTKFLKGAIKS